MVLDRYFYTRSPILVAQALLGKVFVNNDRSLIITETEAYLGTKDLASHARFGPTRSKRIMWEAGGHLYIYLIYGMYEMTNIITGNSDEPGAVLLRAGIVPNTREVISGPGRLSRYMGITRQDNGLHLADSPSLLIEDCGIVPKRFVATPRIGIDYAGVWAKKKLRYIAII